MKNQLSGVRRNLEQPRQSSSSSRFITALMPLLSLYICHEMINATSKFWDDTRHVFHLGDQEIVPLVEEVEGMLGVPSDGPVITPWYPTRISRNLSTILYLSKHLHGNYLQYGEVILLNLLLTFQFRTWQFSKNASYEIATENNCILIILGSTLTIWSLNTCHVQCTSIFLKLLVGVFLDHLFWWKCSLA